ncbi:MAG: glycosyltransferase [Actinomycetota bacterium]|nr:glycosyltransferase [Actinomycetota bacterium]
MIETFIYALILLLSLILTAQAIFTVGFMLYAWARPERLEETSSPDTYLPPSLGFSAILPARHEEGVIGHTMHRVWEADYPKELLEIVVVCQKRDVETIAEAERAAAEIGDPNVRVVTFEGGPINKPHGLNVALGETTKEVVTIFDAEDDVHPEILNVVNTIMQGTGASIVQAGVQLMNFQSSWYSVQNVLEYFFWFKSRLHLHARVGMIPLGGNTVFMRRSLIEIVGGWDEKCLTEDADIGIRLSVLGEKIAVTYDAEHATREETPSSVASFIKQRTRWSQGFLQILRKGVWRHLPMRRQRLLACYTLAYPFFHAATGMLWVPAIVAMVTLKVPVALAMLSLLPLYALGFQFLVSLVGLFDFAKAYNSHIRIRDLVRFVVGFLPYQLLLSVGALRAVYREILGITSWEKTAHTGAHRQPEVKPAYTGISPGPVGKQLADVDTRRRPSGSPRPQPVVLPTPFQLSVEQARSRLGIERGSITILGSKGDVFLVSPAESLQEVA